MAYSYHSAIVVVVVANTIVASISTQTTAQSQRKSESTHKRLHTYYYYCSTIALAYVALLHVYLNGDAHIRCHDYFVGALWRYHVFLLSRISSVLISHGMYKKGATENAPKSLSFSFSLCVCALYIFKWNFCQSKLGNIFQRECLYVFHCWCDREASVNVFIRKQIKRWEFKGKVSSTSSKFKC